jgi:hypothetical protein
MNEVAVTLKKVTHSDFFMQFIKINWMPERGVAYKYEECGLDVSTFQTLDTFQHFQGIKKLILPLRNLDSYL